MTSGSSMLAMIRSRLAVAGKPGVLRVPLDQTAPVQHMTDRFGDLLHHDLQLRAGGRRQMAEHRRQASNCC